MNASAAIVDKMELRRLTLAPRSIEWRSTSQARGRRACPQALQRAGSPLSRSTDSREYASLPRASARPSRHATAGDPLLLRLQWVRATNCNKYPGFAPGARSLSFPHYLRRGSFDRPAIPLYLDTPASLSTGGEIGVRLD